MRRHHQLVFDVLLSRCHANQGSFLRRPLRIHTLVAINQCPNNNSLCHLCHLERRHWHPPRIHGPELRIHVISTHPASTVDNTRSTLGRKQIHRQPILFNIQRPIPSRSIHILPPSTTCPPLKPAPDQPKCPPNSSSERVPRPSLSAHQRPKHHRRISPQSLLVNTSTTADLLYDLIHCLRASRKTSRRHEILYRLGNLPERAD